MFLLLIIGNYTNIRKKLLNSDHLFKYIIFYT